MKTTKSFKNELIKSKLSIFDRFNSSISRFLQAMHVINCIEDDRKYVTKHILGDSNRLLLV